MANIKQNTLFFFTQEYPYGNAESYVVNELRVLSHECSKLIIFPLYCKGIPRALPCTNNTVVCLFNDPIQPDWKLLGSNLFTFVSIFFSEFFSSGNKKKFLLKIPTLKSILLQQLYRAKVLDNYVQQRKGIHNFFYSFWTDEWATTLSILKRRGKIQHFISRVHGYDLYEERWDQGIIPFRNFQLKYVDRIFAVSKDGLNYMKRRYPRYEQKIELSHLNVFDEGSNPWAESDEFILVSCSNIIALKRIHLIGEALKHIDYKVRWIHFGDGELKSVLMKNVSLLPKNITVSFRGNVPNAELISFYKQHVVHLFIHMSETEGGVPLVLQEAASFGIPLLAANAGGVPEIVCSKSGILTDKNITPEELAERITNFKHSEMNTQKFRSSVKLYWQRYFDAKVNYRNLYTKLLAYAD